MSDVQTYTIYNQSDIEMVGGHEAPPDSVCNEFANLIAKDNDIRNCTSMAFYLVMGDKEMPAFNKSEQILANIATLVPILAVLQELGRRDIEKIISIPMEWYMRWNKSFDDAVTTGVIEKPKDHLSSKEFGDMMED